MTLRGLPTRAPRVLLDPTVKASTQSAVDFYRPRGARGRLARLALQGAARWRATAPLLDRVTGEATTDERVDLVAAWASQHVRGGVVLAAWLGSPGPHQKMTVSIGEGPHHPPVAFVKAAPIGPVSADLQREAAALTVLGASSLHAQVPRLLECWEAGGRSFVALSALHGRALRVGAPLVVPQTRFLGALRDIDPQLVEAVPAAGMVPSHGDFTPWNLRRQGATLSAFDWESFGLREPSWDVCHYLVQPAAVMSIRPVAAQVRRLVRALPDAVQRHLDTTRQEAVAASESYCRQSAVLLRAEGATDDDRRVALRSCIARAL